MVAKEILKMKINSKNLEIPKILRVGKIKNTINITMEHLKIASDNYVAFTFSSEQWL